MFELRKWGQGGKAAPAVPVLRVLTGNGAEAWEYAREVAASLSGTHDVYRVGGQDELYVVTICGGSPYWCPPADHRGGMHQIGSMGMCWDCWHADCGWVRHPVTPWEADGSAPWGPLCGAQAVFWPDTDDAETGTCCFAAGHAPKARHRDQRTGTWVEADTPGELDENDGYGRSVVYTLPTTYPGRRAAR